MSATTKIVIAGGSATQVEKLQQEFPQATFVAVADAEAQKRELADADAIISWPHPDALPAAKKLRWVHCTSAGIERIRSVPALVEMDHVTLTNARGAHAATIADHCFAFILALSRDVPTLLADKSAKRWDRPARSRNVKELSGSVLGIVGLGKIGSEIARRGLGFGMEIRGVDVNLAADCPGVAEVLPLERLDDLLKEADYLAIAIPITPQTRGLIGKRELALMKPTASIFVMSRGGIVDQDALADALKNGRLAGAGIDATDPEPLPAEHPLWELPNVIISPHSSGASRQTTERGQAILRENVRRFLAGEPLLNVCDKRAGF
ncbi:MAG TPA: D-2-hydroxyacid dehydrogenase [Chloroflexota bacterium]|nr:D-2-hydroxyacid dehydrogenase [Chloroflexota bacterium]